MYFLIYIASGLYLYLLGAAVFGGWETGRSLFRAPWLGYAVLVACLQIAHFFTAINPKFSWTFLGASFLCAGGIVALKVRRMALDAKALPAMSPLVWLALLMAVAWLAFRPVFNVTTHEVTNYDVGLYYLQAMAWTTTFPVVPGLGNLLLHLGFNQSAFLVTSFVDSLGPYLWGYSLFAGVLPWLGLTLSGFALLQGLCALLAIQRKPLEPIEKAYAMSLPAWIYTLLIHNISGNSPDIALACLQIHLFLCFASFLAARESKSADELSELIVLSALILCVKLSSIYFTAAICLLSVGIALTRIGAPRLLGSKQMLYATLAVLVLCLPWTARGIIGSGYPLFPSTALAAPVVWRVPKADVSTFYDITVFMGRHPYPNPPKLQGAFAWVPMFLRSIWDLKDQFARPLSLGGLWMMLFLLLAWKSANFRQRLRHLLFLILPVAFALLVWFFSAPNPRYLGSITWLLPLVASLALISNFSLSARAFVAIAFCFNYFTLGSLRYNTEWAWKKRASGFQEIRRADLREDENPFGVRLHYPRKGNQTFDAPLPSAMFLHPTLKFLDETRGLAGGFRDARIDDHGREIEDG